MDPAVAAALRQELRGDEGEVLRVYDDKTGRPVGAGSTLQGNPTVGVGRNLAARGITQVEAEVLLGNDLAQCEADLKILPWVPGLTPGRQTVIYSLYFNVGLGNPARYLAKWPNFLKQMEQGQWETAAQNLETSQPWATEVGPRAHRLADLVRYG
jgi:lysozyme